MVYKRYKKSLEDWFSDLVDFVFFFGILLVFFGSIFIYGTVKAEHPTNQLIYVGIMLMVGGVLISVVSFFVMANFCFDNKKVTKKRTAFYLKNKNYEKFLVDLDKCKVIDKSWYTNKPKYSYNLLQSLDSLLTNNSFTVNKVNSSFVKIELVINGKRKTFKSDAYRMDKSSLWMLILEKKQTYIYINKSFEKDYHIDLNFLNNPSIV